MKHLLTILLAFIVLGVSAQKTVINVLKVRDEKTGQITLVDSTAKFIPADTVMNTVYKDTGSIKVVYLDTCLSTTTASTGTTAYVRQNLLFTANFDGANPFSPIYSPNQSCCSYSLVIEGDTIRKGTKAMRVDLYKTDATVAGSKRAEVVPIVTDPLYADRWFGASYYFPSSTMGSDADYDLIAQWHPNTSDGSPPLSLRLRNGHWWVAKTNNSDFSSQSFSWYDLGAYSTNTWNDVVIHYSMKADNTGVSQVWINGKKVFDMTGVNNFSGVGNYLKIGDNKSPWMPGSSWGGTQTHRLFYIDEVRYGSEKATYQDVAP